MRLLIEYNAAGKWRGKTSEILISSHSQVNQATTMAKNSKIHGFPVEPYFCPSCFWRKKKRFLFAQLAWVAEASGRLEFLPSGDSMDQDLLLLYGQYRSTLVDHMDVEKASHFDECWKHLFPFHLPSSYLVSCS
ncbi:hypothetical protein Leryth_025493 [Lithospermum erythrorhizon]|nr:hypothetical protein Leryth_025493 [Lithospermum erythrorhizon]